MARVLDPHSARWYHELKAVAYYGETDLEDTIRQHLASLFPDYHVFPFKKEIKSKVTGVIKKPDLAMVRRDFSGWGVIEVELSDHDIGHVLEQTAVFATGEYNAPEMAAYIHRQMTAHCVRRVSQKRLTDLISSSLPKILVIADSVTDEWTSKLKASNVDLCVFEIYKDTRGRYVYRTAGQYPIVPTQEAHCRAHPIIDNMWEIIGSFQFAAAGETEISVVFDDRQTKWAVIEDNQKRYLRFLGRTNPLFPTDNYVLGTDSSRRYYFRKI